MTFEVLRAAHPEAAQAWKDEWTRWLESEGETPEDPDTPWIDVFGDTLIDFSIVGQCVWADRPAEHGFGKVEWMWEPTDR